MAQASTFLIGCFLVLVGAGTPEGRRPGFSDYAVKEIYTGPHASPKIDAGNRYFRTRIREGAKRPVEFAGHFTVPRFGCGTGCSSFYVVDSISGDVYEGFSVSDLPGEWLESHVPDGQELPRIQFRKDSTLFKVNGCLEDRDCGFYDFEMVTGKGLKLLHKKLLPKEDQPTP